MSRRIVIILSLFTFLALIAFTVGFLREEEWIKLAAPSFGIALIALGLGVISIIMASDADRRITEIGTVLTRIENTQEEIWKEQAEQKEQRGSSPQIIPALQALSQYYMDYMNKQKEEDKE